MDLHVTFASRRDLAGQLHQQIRAAVKDGRLQPGERLPPTRELAERLSVSRYTVTAAYDRLIAEGLVTGRTGAGSFVADLAPARPARAHHAGAVTPNPYWATVPEMVGLDWQPRYDFRAGLPDARLFPYQTWRRLVSQQLRASAVGSAMYGHPAGHAGLRAAIARHVGVSRGVHADADDVIVTTGTQQAVDLIARILLRPGDVVAMEMPGYPAPRLLLESHGAHVVGVPVDAEGIVVDALPDDARLVCVTPSHQFPLGMAMSLARRVALLDWAERRGVAVLEDDYDSDFRYHGEPVEPLRLLDRDGRVIYVGTFAKTMLPTLRIGFIVAPGALRQALRAAKFVTDWHTALPTQQALAAFLEEGALARHIRAMRREYQARHELITEILARDFVGVLRPLAGSVGLHLAAIAENRTAEQVSGAVRGAADDDVGVYSLGGFAFGSAAGDERLAGVVLGYGAIAQPDIAEGMRRLRLAFG